CPALYSRGQAEVSWVEARQKDARNPRQWSGGRPCSQCCSQLFGKARPPDREPDLHAVRGFTSQLPERLPSSFEHFSDTGRVKARVAYCLCGALIWRIPGELRDTARERRILVLRSRAT
uniref:Integron gene cassette protein n=1 Tax=Macrostomum lignano TaxID=282301 RepID=A0A1I8FHA6_9PLAT